MGKAFQFVKRAAADFTDDDCMSSGAAIAYYTVFSLPPLLVIVILVANWFGVSHAQIDNVIRQQLGVPTTVMAGGGEASAENGEKSQSSSGPQAAQLATKTLEGEGSVWTKIIGVAVLVFSATGVFAQLQYTLNRVWEVEPDPAQGGIKAFLMKRIFSLGMVVVIVFLLLVSLVVTTVMEHLVGYVTGGAESGLAVALGVVLNIVMTLLGGTLLFAAMYKVLPDVKMSWRDVWIGAAVTAGLFVVGKTGLGWYLKSADVGSGWGNAAASLVALLVWVYYSSLIVLFGAEVTQVWATEYGQGIQPAAGAKSRNAKDENKPSAGRHVAGGRHGTASFAK